MNRDLLATVLNQNGFVTHTAIDGAEAVEITKLELPTLVLMDIQMPKLDGFAALRQLRASDLTANIPVIAVTGNVMPHDLEKIKQYGFDSIIHKPYKIDDLLNTIKSTLSLTNNITLNSTPQ